jgi:AcrR family transcriptional regulator
VPTGADARKRPGGRRAGDSGTREAILDAATELFSQRGYDGSSLRAIAAAAGVDPALIRHFFGGKDTLFAAVVADRTTIMERLAGSLAGDQRSAGLRVAGTYLRLWEDPQTRPVLLAITRSATTSERAAQMLTEALGGKIRAAAGQDAERTRRVALAGSHLFGLAVARHIIKQPSLAEMDLDQLIAQVAPTIQRYLTGNHL